MLRAVRRIYSLRSTLARPLRLSKKRAGLLVIIGLVIVILVIVTYRSNTQTHTAIKKTLSAKTEAKPTTAAPAPVAITPPSSTPLPQTTPILNQTVVSWASQYSFSSSVVVTELTGSRRSASYNTTASVVPASTYKIYVAYAVLHGVERGAYTLNQTTDDGNSIQTDLTSMIVNSNNDAARTLGFMVGWKNINALLKTQGINSTDLYNYVPPSTQPVGDKHTTASDLALTLQKLYTGQLLNPTNTQLLLGLMKTQHYRERIPAGVPSGVTVADKPGWLSPADGVNEYVENDAAIVYGPKSTYILVITTSSSTTSPLANLSRQIYNYLEQ